MGERCIAATFAAAVSIAAAPAWACPSCNRAIEGDPAALAFYWSTLFMIAMPYLLVAVVGGGLAYVYWSAARNAAAPLEPTENMMWSARGPEKEGGR
jgi:hypothetical protein